MHWPCPSDPNTGKPDFEWSWLKTWQIMEELYKANPDKLKAIGVSNISVDFMEELLKVATVVPAANQIELHPYVVVVSRSCNERPDCDGSTMIGRASRKTLSGSVARRVSPSLHTPR